MKTQKLPRRNALRVRLTDHEIHKLESYAKSHECTVSHIIREYIRRLPNSKVRDNDLNPFEQLRKLQQNHETDSYNYNTEVDFETSDFD